MNCSMSQDNLRGHVLSGATVLLPMIGGSRHVQRSYLPGIHPRQAEAKIFHDDPAEYRLLSE